MDGERVPSRSGASLGRTSGRVGSNPTGKAWVIGAAKGLVLLKSTSTLAGSSPLLSLALDCTKGRPTWREDDRGGVREVKLNG